MLTGKSKNWFHKSGLNVIVLALFFCLLSGCKHQVTIQGTVTSSTKAGISGATVALYSGASALKQATTDATGAYKIATELDNGAFTLKATALNYKLQTTTLTVTQATSYVVNFTLIPDSTPTQAPVINSVTPADGSEFIANAKISIQTSAIGSNTPLQYRFAIGGTVVSGWSTSNIYAWQTSASDTGAVNITCDVKDSLGQTASKTISVRIINPTVREILQKVADNYAKIRDFKADMTLSSTLNGSPFGDTQYCRYYFKAPNKEKTETFSTESRTTKTDIIIVNGSTMNLINPVQNVKQQVDLLADAGVDAGQFNQVDIYNNLPIFLSRHTVTINYSNSNLNSKLVCIDATPNAAVNTYDKLSYLIDYTKGIISKYQIYHKDEQNIIKLLQEINTIESQQQANGAWIATKMTKIPVLTSGNLVTTNTYTNLQANCGLTDLDFDPNRQ